MQNLLIQEYFWNDVLAVLASAAGAAAIGMSFFRRGRKDISLVTFGATSLIYGLRLLVSTQLDLFVSAAPPQILLYLTAFCTYVLPIPLSGFLRHLFGAGRKNSMIWAFRGAVAFGIVAVVSCVGCIEISQT